MIRMESSERSLVLKFTFKKLRKRGNRVEVAHFYSSSGSKVFHARCERGVISSFIERVNGKVKQSKTGKTIYLGGSRAEDIFRRLIILAGCRQCVRNEAKITELAEAIAGLGEFETIFWYNKMLEEYENRGYWGVCRVAKAFRVLYRVD